MTTGEIFKLIDKILASDFPIGRNGFLAALPVNGCSRAVGVGTRMDRNSGICYLEPVIHVRSIDIESVFVHLSKEVKPKPRLDQTSTLSRQIGYLEPHNSHHSWAIERDGDAEQVIFDMKQAILKYGPVLWDRFTTKETIFHGVEQGEYLWPGARPYKLPIVYGLTERKQEAVSILMQTANRMRAGGGGMLYAGFVRNWFEYFMPGVPAPV